MPLATLVFVEIYIGKLNTIVLEQPCKGGRHSLWKPVGQIRNDWSCKISPNAGKLSRCCRGMKKSILGALASGIPLQKDVERSGQERYARILPEGRISCVGIDYRDPLSCSIKSEVPSNLIKLFLVF